MKILHTEASAGWGGQEIRILTEAQGLIERGHEVELACPEEARIHGEAARYGVPVHRLPIGRKNLKGILCLREFLATHAFDVVNTHSSTDTWLAAIASRTLRRAPPLVRTRHISAAVPSNASTRWLYATASSHIVTTGETLRLQLLATLPLSADRVTSVPTGVDTDWYAPAFATDGALRRQKLGLPGSGFLIGIVATLRSWKGHRFLIGALAGGKLPTAQLVVVGDGPQREALEKLVDDLGLRARVRFVGNQIDVRPWLQALDVFVLPSYANEGVPQALMQAMAVGLPCVTTPVGAIPELARQGETALLVPPSETSGLADALVRLEHDLALRQAIGSAARRHVVAHYGRSAMLDRMESIFRGVAVDGVDAG